MAAFANEDQLKHAREEFAKVSTELNCASKTDKQKLILSERLETLKKNGFIPDELAFNQKERFFQLRLIELYCRHSKNDEAVNKEAIEFLESICAKLAKQESIWTREMLGLESLVKKAWKDPLIPVIKPLAITKYG